MSNVFLLGAGFSHAASNGKAPLTAQLMNEVKNLIPHELEQEFYYYKDNIESFITALDLRVNNSELSNVKQQFIDTRKAIVDKIITLLDINKIRDDNCKIGTKFLDAVKTSDTILTLNYDCLIDSLLNDKKIWSPKGGYSKWIDSFPGESENTQDILLLKVHGSVNFKLAAPVKNLKTMEFEENNLRINAELSAELFRNSGIGHLGILPVAERGEYVIIPTYVKTYHWQIIRLWELAVKKMQQAVNLTVIGCGLREEDTMLHLLLSFFNYKNKGKIYIIDKNANIVTDKITKFTGTQQSIIKQYKSEFNEKVLEEYLSNYLTSND